MPVTARLLPSELVSLSSTLPTWAKPAVPLAVPPASTADSASSTGAKERTCAATASVTGA